MAYLLDAKADVAESDDWVPIADSENLGDLAVPAARLLDTSVSTELRLVVSDNVRSYDTVDFERINAMVKHRDGNGDL